MLVAINLKGIDTQKM